MEEELAESSNTEQPKKPPKTIIVSVVITAVIIGGLVCGLFQYRLLTVKTSKSTNPVSPLITTTSDTNKIAIGQPCDFRIIPEGSAVPGSEGLQCYLYGPGSETRPGIWIQPNHVEKLNFFDQTGSGTNQSFSDIAYDRAANFVTSSWATYTNPDKVFSFKYPAGTWKLITNSNYPDQMNIVGDPNFNGTGIGVEYFANTNFDQSTDGQLVPNKFPGGSSSLNDDLQYLQNFKINGKQAYGIIMLPKVNRGGDPENVEVYIIGDQSYLRISYERTNDFSRQNFPIEAFIKTIQIK